MLLSSCICLLIQILHVLPSILEELFEYDVNFVPYVYLYIHKSFQILFLFLTFLIILFIFAIGFVFCNILSTFPRLWDIKGFLIVSKLQYHDNISV